ncbi:MAG: hypothetical protein C4346_01150 [Chloroflexota bacterium]
MIIVRRGELACRNGWSQDLWTPKTEADGDTDVVLHQPVVAAQPLPPVSAEEIRSVINAQRFQQNSDPPSQPVDVVVGEAPVIEPPEPRQSLLHHDTRSAILKAREQYRERLRSQARQTGIFSPVVPHQSKGEVNSRPHESPTAQAAGARSSERADPGATTRARTDGAGVVPPVRIDELPRPYPTMTTFPEDEERFSTVPKPEDGIELPRRPAQERPKVLRTSDVESDEAHLPVSRAGIEPARAGQAAPKEAGTPIGGRASPLAPPLWRHARRVERFRAARDGESGAPADFESSQIQVEPTKSDPAGTPPLQMNEMEYREAPRERSGERVDPVYEDVGESELPDLLPRVAPELPRICRTCRDFRPTEGGERGWCTNPWAFSHRRMVDADELPCLTSIGCWWLPNDDIWLEKADISAHGQPTPLVDQWLGSRSGTNAGAQVANQRRRGRQ